MKRILNFVITVFILLILEYIFARYLSIAGLIPNLMLLYVIFISLNVGVPDSILFGFFCGLSYDVVLGDFFCITAMSYSAIGYIIGSLAKKINEKDFLLQILTFTAGSLISILFRVAISLMLTGEPRFFSIELITSSIYTLLFIKPFHLIFERTSLLKA